MSPVVFVILCFKENDSQFGKERVMRYRREKEGGKNLPVPHDSLGVKGETI